MKTTAKLLALALAFVLLVGMLAACGTHGLSGVYTTTEGYSYTFSGNNFTNQVGTVTMKGTYEIVKIDEDYRIMLTVKETGVDGKMTKLTEDKYYVLGGDDGLEYLERETDDGTPYIKIDELFYYLVK